MLIVIAIPFGCHSTLLTILIAVLHFPLLVGLVSKLLKTFRFASTSCLFVLLGLGVGVNADCVVFQELN